MIQSRIQIKRYQLDRFRHEALENTKEIFAFLVGVVESPTLTVVDWFEYPDYSSQSFREVTPEKKSEREIYQQALINQQAVVGTIHSHLAGGPS